MFKKLPRWVNSVRLTNELLAAEDGSAKITLAWLLVATGILLPGEIRSLRWDQVDLK